MKKGIFDHNTKARVNLLVEENNYPIGIEGSVVDEVSVNLEIPIGMGHIFLLLRISH